MKKDLKRLVLIILGIIFLCVLLTFIIVKVLVYKKEMAVTQRVPMEVTFENAYITSLEEGNITFLYNGSLNTFKGVAESDCIGVCDVVVKEGQIQKIYTKKNTIEGNLLKYSNNTMYIQQKDEVIEKKYKDDFPVYSLTGKKVEQISTGNLVLGESELTYVVSGEQIVALLQYQPSTYHNIRVLMKNKDQVYYNFPIYLEKDGDFSYIRNENGERLTRNCIGTLEILEDENGYVVINTLPVEDYVRYVTPSEMPHTWGMEALKAQAVCARTYAYAQMKNSKYAAFGANLDNTVDYQVYNNVGLKESTNQAADETKYQVLTCDNQLITCYFFSTSAGRTNTMDVWEGRNPAFLHSVSSEDTGSDLYSWNAELDYSREDENELGAIQEIRIFERNEGGYVTNMMIRYEKGSKTYKNEYKIRDILADHVVVMKDKTGRKLEGWGLLPSAAFTIEEESDTSAVKIKGNGYGHGIGLSQYGAGQMAEQGMTYDEILKYYYANVDLVDVRQILK